MKKTHLFFFLSQADLRHPYVQSLWQAVGNGYGYNSLGGPCAASLLGGGTSVMPPGRAGAVRHWGQGEIPDCQDCPFPAHSWFALL